MPAKKKSRKLLSKSGKILGCKCRHDVDDVSNACEACQRYHRRYGAGRKSLNQCPKGGDHDIIWDSARSADGEDGIIDVWCKKCHQSGSVRINPKDIQW